MSDPPILWAIWDDPFDTGAVMADVEALRHRMEG
jgi:hypothetical protein